MGESDLAHNKVLAIAEEESAARRLRRAGRLSDAFVPGHRYTY